MNHLREQMIGEMERRNYAEKTIREYVKHIIYLSRYFGRSPAELTLEDVRQYQLYLCQRKRVSWSYYNGAVCAIRFLYRETLRKDWPWEQIPFGKKEHKLPVILSRQEVFQLWQPLYRPKRRLLLMTAYSAALRLSELRNLRVDDLDEQRMLIRIRQGKGRRDRFVPYSRTLKQELTPYLTAHGSPWLFPGNTPDRPLCPRAVQDICIHAAKLAKLQKALTIHILRHTAATHWMEKGVDLRTIQRILGHKRLSSTARYTHLSFQHLQGLVSPLDLLPHDPGLEEEPSDDDAQAT